MNAWTAADLLSEPTDLEEGGHLPRLWYATDLVPASKPRWLAKGRVPRGATTILVGEEGIGKSLLWVWITAAITTGRELPGFGLPERTPEKVVIVITEDDWSFQVRPRLELAGADLSMIQVICTDRDGSGSPVFPVDLYLLDRTDAALVVVDAWLDTVPSALNVRDPQHARQALHPWKELATKTGAAVLLLTHTNRVASSSARDKYAATIELRKKARMTLYAQQDDEGLLVVGPEKSNMTKLIAASRFGIVARQVFEADDDGDGTVPCLEFVGESTMTARDLVSEKHEAEHGTEHGSQDEAAEWLRTFLADEERDAETVIKAAEKVGISKRTLDRAKKKAGAVSRKSAFSGGWVWVLTTKDATRNAKNANQTSTSQLGNLGNLGGLEACQVCGGPMALDDGTGTHPTCEAA